MEFHNLLADNNYNCLYCQGRCDMSSTSIGYPALIIEAYSCQKCQEVFETEHIDNNYYGFAFTCNGLKAFYNYQVNQFGLSKVNFDIKIRNNLVWVPYFDINFSNKQDLFKKIKTYTTFA